MMRFITILFVLLYSLNGLSQSSYPIYQSFGSTSTLTEFKGAGKAGHAFINGVYTDTSSANLIGYFRFYPGAQIMAGDSFYLRDKTASRWLLINGSGGGGGGTWGSITGTLSNQTDLQAALNLKTTQSALDDTAAAIRGDFPGTPGIDDVLAVGQTIATNRTIGWNTGVSSSSSLTFRPIVGGSSLTSGHFALTYVDTVPNPDADANKSVGFYSKRIYRIPAYTSTTYRTGANIAVDYEINDSVKLNSVGGDFGGSVRTDLQFKKLTGYSGRSVYVIGAQTLNDNIPVHLANMDWGGQNSTVSNHKYIKGYLVGHQSYAIGRANDTLENWVGFNNMGFFPGGHIKNTYDYIGGYMGAISATNVGNPWGVFIWSARSRNYFAGALNIGDSSATPSALLNVTSTTKGVVFPRMTGAQQNAISSPLTGLMIYNTDSSAYCFYNGSAWNKMGTGSGVSATAFNDIGDATGSGLVSIGNNSQQWDFTGLTGSGLLIQSNSTAATSFLHKLFRVITTGANASSSVTSIASEIVNSHTGTSSTNIGLMASATNGTNNHAIIVGENNGNVGFGTQTPNASAILELVSTTRGFLTPRMNTTQQDAIALPIAGLMIYNTDSSLFRYYNGSAWVSIGTGSSGGLDVGSTAITGGTNTRVLYNNSGVLGEYSVTGSGTTVPLSTSPDFTTGITIGSVAVPTISSTNTLTNKRITARYSSTSSSATPTVNTDNVDVFEITALAVDITSMTTNLSGTPNTDDVIHFIITGTATRAITWGSSFENSTVSWPTTTNGTNRLDVYGIWNSTTSKWRCTGVH